MNIIGITIMYIFIFLGNVILPAIFLTKITSTYSLIINPIFWILISAICFFFKGEHISIKSNKKNVIKSVLIVILIYVIIYYLSGLIFGYLRTPYSHSLKAIFKNILSMTIIVILQEYVRFILLINCNKNKIMYLITTLMFVVINIEFSNFSNNFSNVENSFKYISSFLLPELIRSALCTYLVIKATNVASSIYRIVPIICLIIFPIVPDFNWFLSGISQVILSFFIFIKINYEFMSKDRNISKSGVNRQKPYKLIPFLIFVVIFVCFIVGVFKYAPVSILSNSMVPKFSKGDVVIIKKLSDDEKSKLQTGDIIDYANKDRYIVHRIIKIERDNNKNVYQTKGDNNPSPDVGYVKNSQIEGVVKLVIPFIGYPAVYLNNLL